MHTICSTCGGLLTSSSQHRSGCNAATTRFTRRSASMAELTNNCESDIFAPASNEHILFAGTLRNWSDPMLQGRTRTPVSLCSRCVSCRYESLKDVRNSSTSPYRHYHRHDPSCPNFRQHERAKTSSRQRLINQPKRRANSCEPEISLNSHTSLIKQKVQHSPSPSPTVSQTQRKQSISKIPVRIRSSTVSTTASEHSPSSSSINESHSLNIKSRLPRPISTQNLSSNNHLTNTNGIRSSSDDGLDHDSLNEHVHQRTSSMSNHDLSATTTKKKKTMMMMMMHCADNSTNEFDPMDEQFLLKKKKKSTSPRKPSRNESASEKRLEKFRQIEGRHSKSKTAGTPPSPINDLSSTTSSSPSSSFSHHSSSSNQLRKQPRPYRLASPSQPQHISSLSDDSLSEHSERLSKKRRPRSAFLTYETSPRSSRLESTPTPRPASVYLIEVTNNNRPSNSFGLSKTVTYVWKSSPKKKGVEDFTSYPKYSVEQVPPMAERNERTVPVSSRHIILQRGKTDSWQNMKTVPDSLLTSSCQTHTGSASNLLSPTFDHKPTDPIKRRRDLNGHVISITTTKRRQPSLLNQSQNTEWNVEGDGKQLRYSNLKWHSVDQLEKDNRLITKAPIQRKQTQVSDSTTDTGSSSEQYNRSAPPILQRKSNSHLINQTQEVFEDTAMNKPNDLVIPDYSLFHREISDTSSPIIYDEEQQNNSSSSSKEVQRFGTIINENSPPKPTNNSYASTDEDVDELYLDDSEVIDRPIATIQTYRDRLNARINPQMSTPHPRIFFTEHSQITHDSGVDILSEQKHSHPKVDEQYSEQTANQNESDDSLLDIETAHTNDILLRTPPPTIYEQSISFTDEIDGERSYLSPSTDNQLINRTDHGLTNTSDQYYSAESEFNTSLSFPNNDPFSGYELENVSDDEEVIPRDSPRQISRSPTPQFDFKLPTFGAWIDQVFTTFLAETNQQSTSTTRSSSIISIHTSQNTIDTSSSQILTIIEGDPDNRSSRNSLESEKNHSLHRRSLSWPDEQRFKETSSASLYNENNDLNNHTIANHYENIHSNSDDNPNSRSKSLLSSSIESDDEEVINKATMQNDHFHHQPTNIEQNHSDDENISLPNPTTNIDAEKVEEKEHADTDDDGEKHIEIGVETGDDDDDDDKLLIRVAMPDDSSTFALYEEFSFRESAPQAHTNSHDSLLQPDHQHPMDTIHTTTSSTDDLSTAHQLSSSVFHSKDSALGLSDDNLNLAQTNPLIIMDDDEEDDDQREEEQLLSSSLIPRSDDQIEEINVTEETANNNISQNGMTYESSNHNNNHQSQATNNTMIWINDQPSFISTSYLNERTVSTSSLEQLTPRDKQNGVYSPVFGISAAVHLAEKYNCEWLQDVSTPSSTAQRSSIILEHDDLSDSRIFRQHQLIGDDDEFVVTFQALQPSSSCPNLISSITHEPLRERSYSLTTLDAYARLDITRDTLEQMWLSLLDLAFSDKDDFELGEYKLRHIRGLSNSYSNMNETLIEKSRSHDDIFSSINRNEQFTTKKSKSFDVTALPKTTTTTHPDDSANVGLLQGAAISEPFVDRVGLTSTHSDTEPNLLDIDSDSIQSLESDNQPLPEREESPIHENTSPVIKEPLNYIFRHPHQLYADNDDDYDFEQMHDVSSYLPERTLTADETYGDEDRQLEMALSSDFDEAPAVLKQVDARAELENYRPHSLSTIPSSRASQYALSVDDSDDFPDQPEDIRRSTISGNQEESSRSEYSDHGEGSDTDTSLSRVSSPGQTHSPIPPESNQQINFSNINYHEWERSIDEPFYTNDLTNSQSAEQGFFTFPHSLTQNILKEAIAQAQQSPRDQIESKENPSVEQTIESNLIDFSSYEDSQEKMDSQHDEKSTNSTHTSLSSIHDTQLDAAELAHRLAQLGPLNSSSPPKLTFAEELAELNATDHRFEHDSLDHSPVGKGKKESSTSSPHSYATSTPPGPLRVEELTSIARDIRQINQDKSISSLCTIVEDIHAQTNNQFLTKIVDYHESPPIANLQTIMTELHQTPLGKVIPRPQRPTHLSLEQEEEVNVEDDDADESPFVIENIPISSNTMSDLEQQLAAYKTKSPSPPPAPVSAPATRRISEPPAYSTRYHSQRIEKVSDLEIVKQGKGFKIGYVDRQGTDQRVILTKRIEAGPDIMARAPHSRQQYKGRKILKPIYSSVLYTNGYNTIQEDGKFRHTSDDIEVPVIGTNPQHFDESDMISIDIDGPSTMLNSICESIVITQGSVYTTNPPKPSIGQSVTQSISKILDHHEEYLLDSSRTPTPPNKKDKIEVIDTWQDQTVINGNGTTWRSPSVQTYKATKHIQPSYTAQPFVAADEPNTVQMRIAPSHDVKYRTSKHIDIPAVYDWNDETVDTPRKEGKMTRDIALSPIIMEKKQYQTSSTSPQETRRKVDRACQYSPPPKHDLGLQCHFDQFTSETQVSSHDIPNFLISDGGTQTVNDSNPPFDDSGIHTQVHTISPALSVTSSENQQAAQPFTLSGPDFIRRLDEQRSRASTLTVTQYTDGNYYLPLKDNHSTTTTNLHPATLERSADSGILVDEQSSRLRPAKANFALQVNIKDSSSDSEDVSEATQRPVNRLQPPSKGDLYEHHSELLITTRSPSKSRQNSASNEKRFQQPRTSSPQDIEQQILQLRRERAHILDLLALNWSRSNIWVELTEAKLNYIIGETDALLRSLSFDATSDDSERVKSKVHQYEEEMAELTRQRLAVYRERLEDSKKLLDMKIDELEAKKSSADYHAAHYSTLEFTPRVNNNRYSKSFLSTSAENLTNIPSQEIISSHPQFLDVSFLTTSNQAPRRPPRYPRSPRYSQAHQSADTYRTVYRPTPRYQATLGSSTEHRYDSPRHRSTSFVTPAGNLEGMQGLTKSQQAILDETDRLVRDSQQFHHESATQFERARESLLSSETPIRLARANMAASRLSPNSNYLPNDVTLAELFKYEQSLARETAKNTRTYSSISTSAES